MENRKPASKQKLHNQEEKLINRVKCASSRADSSKKQLTQDLGIPQIATNPTHYQGVQLTVHPRSPAIKTLFLAENSRFKSAKGSEKSGSLLAIGDHLSCSNYCAETRSVSAITIVGNKKRLKKQERSNKTIDQELLNQEERPLRKPKKDKKNLESAEKCYVYAQRYNAKHHNLKKHLDKESNFDTKKRKIVDAESSVTKLSTCIHRLNNKLEILKSFVRKQDIVLILSHSDAPNCQSSSDEDSRDNMVSRGFGSARPGCSYIEHYSYIPQTSAFQRYAQGSSSLLPSKCATIEKEHNSELYNRDFATYDRLTGRVRRQCNSATCKRADVPQAAERMIKIRQKLSPVRDYRLMDTVHYLAQGEFAPRNDGIKLTPSREAVLSDIIWEDVCRTHWPSARLGRRHGHHERCNTRNELQCQIDSLLRERVAHVERRRRRRVSDVSKPIVHTQNASGLMLTSTKWPEGRTHRSDDRLTSPEKRGVVQEECTPGPRYAVSRSRREPTCCYHAAGTLKQPEGSKNAHPYAKGKYSSSNTNSSDKNRRNPRLVIKKEPSRKMYHERELNLEHFILLPTLVVRTPSNVRRQKKFNDLYQRILNKLSIEHNTEPTQSADPSHRQCKSSVTSMDRGDNK